MATAQDLFIESKKDLQDKYDVEFKRNVQHILERIQSEKKQLADREKELQELLAEGPRQVDPEPEVVK